MKNNTATNERPSDKNIQIYPSLEQVTSPTVPTDAAAYYLNRRSQTLRSWACLENGPLRPIKINGRLAWSVSALKALIGGGAV
jgi:hypothetical protein